MTCDVVLYAHLRVALSHRKTVQPGSSPRKAAECSRWRKCLPRMSRRKWAMGEWKSCSLAKRQRHSIAMSRKKRLILWVSCALTSCTLTSAPAACPADAGKVVRTVATMIRASHHLLVQPFPAAHWTVNLPFQNGSGVWLVGILCKDATCEARATLSGPQSGHESKCD